MSCGVDEKADARTEAARRKTADCDDRLAKYRAALDTGAGGTTEVQGERLKAELDLGASVPGEHRTKEQVKTLFSRFTTWPRSEMPSVPSTTI
jgi:hypothetical protein